MKLNIETEIKLVKKLKSLAINHQMYESAANLRDMERKLIDSLPDGKGCVEAKKSFTIQPIGGGKILDINEYNYLIDLTLKLQDKGKEYKGRKWKDVIELRSKKYEKIRNDLKSECIHIIREEKLNKLFKD